MPVRRAVLADVSAQVLYTRMLADVPGRLLADLERFQIDGATVKLDWSLDGPIPWANGDCAGAGTVHLGGDLDDRSIDDRQAEAWLAVLNDLRLVMATRLGVTDDSEDQPIDDADPDAGARIVYAYAGWLEGQLVDVLADALPEVPEDDPPDPPDELLDEPLDEP